MKTTKTKKTNRPSVGGPCGSWTPTAKVRAAKPWKIHTPRSRWFSEVTVTKAVTA